MAEPVTLSEAKQHLRVELSFTLEDSYISGLITAARSFAESYTHQDFHSDISSVPEEIKHAILILLAHWFEIREPVAITRNIEELPFSVRAILDLHDRRGL